MNNSLQKYIKYGFAILVLLRILSVGLKSINAENKYSQALEEYETEVFSENSPEEVFAILEPKNDPTVYTSYLNNLENSCPESRNELAFQVIGVHQILNKHIEFTFEEVLDESVYRVESTQKTYGCRDIIIAILDDYT